MRGLIGLVLVLSTASVLAQAVYRQVDKNGKVTFSDQPPVVTNAPTGGPQPAGANAPANSGLPYELRQVAQRYPVTLYSGEGCGPCNEARTLLTTRGIPFEERTIKSNEDVDALQRLSGQNALPLLTVGSQQLKGFSDVEWSRYLDAAGYPKSNSLPPGYRPPAARPLVAQQAPAAAAPRATDTPLQPPNPAPAPPSNAPGPNNPAGIKF
ncbi:glutaredoxin family protein [Variovorax boronicumulans]|uniref:glutaredoxin family protein n=1 Tax=Variovorax boronicumulans TaxID=436515 RepID=UPI0036F196D2